jgi:hypothetical protein
VQNKICYYALYDPNSLQGVHRKIEATLTGLKSKGIDCYLFGTEDNIKPSFKNMVINIIKSKDKVIILRSIAHLNILLIPFLIFSKLKGTIIIFDIPTPFKSAMFEIKKINQNYFFTFINLISTLIGSFLIMIISDLLLVYGNDFKIYNKLFSTKIKLVSNFYSNNSIQTRNNLSLDIKNKINLIAVGNFSFSQGFDLILEAIYIWNKNENNTKVYLNLIGSGDFEFNLREICNKYEIYDFVKFHGYLNYNEYKYLYNLSHIAVGSIASYRKNLTYHSPLKEREYALVGIPFFSSGIDIAFSSNCKFRVIVRKNYSIEDITYVFANIDEISKINPTEISDYAIKNISFDNFFNNIKSILIKNKIIQNV